MKFRSALLAATILGAAPIVAKAQPVSGLYIGAGAGANFMQNSTLNSVGFQQNSAAAAYYGPAGGVGTSGRQMQLDPGFVGLASVGWGLGNGLRIELEGSYRDNKFTKVARFSGVSANGTFGSGTFPGGSFGAGGDEMKYGAMVNAVYDIPIAWPVVPYFGLGVGYQFAQDRNARIYGNTAGITPPPGYNFLLRSNDGDGSFAGQAIAGIAYPLPMPGLSLTAEYRFMALAQDRTYNYQFYANGPTPGGINTRATVKMSDDYNHSVLLGIRYAFNAAPPPVMVQPAPPMPPSASRTYLVFFDWDRADLTDRARQIIAEAAQATTRVQVTRIEVNGYTDLSGTVRYNQGLSVRRAQNVANELVRLGVPRSAIVVRGFGESNPLVPTAQGVREPQNRRVEIILR